MSCQILSRGYNRITMANPIGRPREYDLKKIAADFLKWAATDDAININKFCALNDLTPTQMIRWKDADADFRIAYEKVRTWLAFRREERLSAGKLHVKAYDLNATVYDAFTREEKLAMAKAESEIAKDTAKTVGEDQKTQMAAVMNQLAEAQARAKACTSNNTDCKS